MAMSYIWSGLVILSFLWGFFHGNLSSVAAAALDGAQSALELSLSMAGILCLWSGVMEILNVCGLSRRIAALFRPLLRRLLPNASRDEETLAAVSANVSANLLGLGNAATPLGIQAARRMAQSCGGTASDELCLLVVLNTASIQLQDLDGDGQRESAVAFIRVPGVEKSLKIYIFTATDGDYQVRGLVEGDGSAIYSVDYVDLNGAGSKELVVNWQVNTGVYQLGAYTLDELELEPAADAAALPQNQLADRASLRATELLLTSCSTAMEGGAYSSGYRLLDIDQDTRTEVAVVRLDAAALSGQVELYGWRNGRMESLSTTALSAGITGLNRVTAGYLAGTYYPPALYITCAQSDGSRTTDVVAYQPGGHEGEMHLVNLALNDHGVSRERLRGTAELGPSDVNNDVVLELPQVRMLPQDRDPGGASAWLVDWYQYDQSGQRSRVMGTYYNVTDGWFLETPDSWEDKISVSRSDVVSGQRQVVFSLWQGEDEPPVPFLSIYKLTGSNRTTRAQAEGVITLREEEDVIYAAQFYDCGWDCGLTENDLLMKNFQTIQTSWYS